MDEIQIRPRNWRAIADQVKLECNYTCADCGRITRFLHAHHIDEDVANNNHENLVVLCAKCHMNRHHPNTNKREHYAAHGLTDAQKRELNKISDITGRTITDLMREAANVLIAQYRFLYR